MLYGILPLISLSDPIEVDYAKTLQRAFSRTLLFTACSEAEPTDPKAKTKAQRTT